MHLLQSFFNMMHWLAEDDFPRQRDDPLGHPDIVSMRPWQLADLPLSRPDEMAANHVDPAAGPSPARGL